MSHGTYHTVHEGVVVVAAAAAAGDDDDTVVLILINTLTNTSSGRLYNSGITEECDVDWMEVKTEFET